MDQAPEQLDLSSLSTRNRDPASFRDPSGFVFRDPNGRLCRQVNKCYDVHYRAFKETGLLDELVGSGKLIEHEEISTSAALTDEAVCVLAPRELPMVSYPYEWCFSALKDAALLTLDIQLRAMRKGMTLKDASAYNVQFEGTFPVFIDTLSFEKYEAGTPWIAYGQFCRHFLAPLALMAKCDLRLNRLLILHLDGIPLDMACKMLPWRMRLLPSWFAHLFLHSRLTQRYSDTSERSRIRKEQLRRSRRVHNVEAIVENLIATVEACHLGNLDSEWSDYYKRNSYGEEEFDRKRRCVARFLDSIQPGVVWDLGANTGEFSRIACSKGSITCAFDMDPVTVELAYRCAKKEGGRTFLPLCVDLANPSPGIGWAHVERRSLLKRGPADLAMALALIHHLRIGNNTPFLEMAAFFQKLCRALIVEYVPKHDSQVARLLQGREDIFDDYDRDVFESVFSRFFVVKDREPIGESGRTLYLMESRTAA